MCLLVAFVVHDLDQFFDHGHSFFGSGTLFQIFFGQLLDDFLQLSSNFAKLEDGILAGEPLSARRRKFAGDELVQNSTGTVDVRKVPVNAVHGFRSLVALGSNIFGTSLVGAVGLVLFCGP